MAMMLGGIIFAMVDAAATRAAELGGLYPSLFMGGSITRPMAATSALEEPEIPAKNILTTVTTWARPPRMWPTNAWAKLTSRSVTFEDAMISPSSMKKGTASKGTTLMPLNISATTVAMLMSVRSTPIMTLAMTAKGTGTPRTPNRTNKNAIRPTTVHSLTLQHPLPAYTF